eukprot:SAG31_NODE_30_length_32545_cov_9.378999_3_plen_121_part_00
MISDMVLVSRFCNIFGTTQAVAAWLGLPVDRRPAAVAAVQSFFRSVVRGRGGGIWLELWASGHGPLCTCRQFANNGKSILSESEKKNDFSCLQTVCVRDGNQKYLIFVPGRRRTACLRWT